MDQAQRIELLLTDQLAPVTEAIADLVAHGTPEEWNELVRGYESSGGLGTSKKRGPLRTETPYYLRIPTMLRLLADAPAGTEAAAIRDKISSLRLSGSKESQPYSTPRSNEMRALDVGHLARFPALRALELMHSEEVHGLEEILATGRISWLELLNLPLTTLDLSPAKELSSLRLSRLPKLRTLRGLSATLGELKLSKLPALTELPLGAAHAISTLALSDTPALPRPASQLGALTSLSCDLQDDAWLAELSALTDVTLWNTTGTAPFNRKPKLETLQLFAGDQPVVMAPMDLPALETLEIYNLSKLTTMAGLAGSKLPAVKTLEVLRNDALTSLAGLEVTPAVTEVKIQGDALVDLSAAAAWTEVESLHLRCPALTDVSPLAGLRKLKTLSLSGCRELRDLMPLAKLKLEKLICSESGVTKTGIPDSLHEVVHPPSLVAKSKARAPRGVKPKPAKGEARTTLAKLKKLLLTRDWEKLSQGLELLRTLDDAELYEGLLSGSTLERQKLPELFRRWEEVQERMPAAYDVVKPNALLAYGKPLRPFREALIRALVGLAPEGSKTAAKLRTAWKHLVCTGAGRDHDYGPVDLEPLTSFPQLTTLVISSASAIDHQDALARIAKLKSLALLWIQHSDLSGLASPSLETLCIDRGQDLERLFPLSGFPRVTDLVLHYNGGPQQVEGHFPRLVSADVEGEVIVPLLTALARSPLERLTVRATGDAKIFAPLAKTKTLTDLTIQYGDDLEDLSPLNKLGSLRRLSLRRCAPQGIGELALSKLEELEIWRTTLTDADARGLAKLPKLEKLVFDEEVELAAPLPPKLAKLVKKTRS